MATFRKGPPHVYISLVGKGTPLRLTPESESDWGPSWSPDGQSIAFLRARRPRSKEPELHVMPALGGAKPQDCERYGHF